MARVIQTRRVVIVRQRTRSRSRPLPANLIETWKRRMRQLRNDVDAQKLHKEVVALICSFLGFVVVD